MRSTIVGAVSFLWLGLGSAVSAAESSGDAAAKEQYYSGPTSRSPVQAVSAPEMSLGGGGYRLLLSNGVARVPLVVVGGTPYEMGWHLGRLLKEEMHRFIPPTLEGFRKQLNLTPEDLAKVWATTAAYTDDRFEQELLGLSEGSGLPLALLQQAHCLPLLMPYSCSSIAAWGKATADGHLYQTRNLDWNREAGAHEFPALVVYLPREGNAHVIPTFAGIIGAHCGLSAAGIALSEMGDASRKEMPYELRAPHFTTWFRTLLYEASGLTDVVSRFQQFPMTKRYHFVFGDGRREQRAVKIRAHSPEPAAQRVRIWQDNDPADELAPHVLSQVVYQDEGRGAFPTLKTQHGQLNAEKMMSLCNQIPIRGGNVMNAVFDATALRLWVSYAGGPLEAFQRPYVFADLTKLDGDGDGKSDLQEGSADRNSNGRPDFLDP